MDGDGDEALFLLAPQIARQTSATASNAGLMRELGVLERAEYQTAAKAPDVKESLDASAGSDGAAVDVMSLMGLSPWLLRVCQTGIQAQVCSFVILQHLWQPFGAAPAAAPARLGGFAGRTADEPLQAPPMEWAASLPASVRALLLSHELQRVNRRRRYANRGVQGDVAVTTEVLQDVYRTPLCALSEMWAQTVQESRAVVLCCCAPWLRHHSTHANSSTAGSEAALSLERLLFAPLERQVLEVGIKLCAVCQAEDVAQSLMAIFIRGVDSVTSSAPGQNTVIAAPTEAVAFKTWYATEVGTLYESAMTAAAAPRTHASLSTSCVYSTVNGGFPLAYSYLVHRGLTMARLSAVSSDDRDNSEDSAAPEASLPSPRGSCSWTSSLTKQPRGTMRLLYALAGGVDANADHFNVVLQLYLRLVEETDAGYNDDCVKDTRLALCAVLNSLARVPLKTATYLSFLEEVYRRTLIHSAIDVTQHPDVLASCLRVCSVAGVSSRAVTLFNKLSEPASRAIAAEERNVAAVVLSTPAAGMTLQRLVSYMHTKIPVTADVVHAAAVQALVTGTGLVCANTSTAFAFFDLLELKVAAQHHVTHITAASFADRTFFLRILTVLAGVHEQRCGGSAVSEALTTPAAAAMFRQWVASAEQHQPRNISWASALPPVTVGVLQELALELRRAARADSQVSSDSCSAVPTSSLLAAVEEVLHAAAGGLPTSVRPIDSINNGDTFHDCCTVYCLPHSLQWRQLQTEWQHEEQRRFLDSALRLLQASNPGSTVATSCVRYQDWAVLHDLQLRCGSATSQEYLADAWTSAVSMRSKQPQASTSTSSRVSAGVAADCVALCVLTPLAEVEWWFMQDSASPSHTSRMKTASLSENIGVAVPPAVGCPAHMWSSEQAGPHGDARARRTKVVMYWLQRWVDSVEDVRAWPRHSVFRMSVVRMLQQSAAASFAAEGNADTAEQDEACEVPSASSDRPGTVSSPALASAKANSSGVESMFVRGPASIVYRA
nr:unnamed protein product [Leishmania braziliensis]